MALLDSDIQLFRVQVASPLCVSFETVYCLSLLYMLVIHLDCLHIDVYPSSAFTPESLDFGVIDPPGLMNFPLSRHTSWDFLVFHHEYIEH